MKRLFTWWRTLPAAVRAAIVITWIVVPVIIAVSSYAAFGGFK